MADDFRRVLRGQPSLRRSLRNIPDNRIDQFQTALSDIDPRRFRGLYRQRLGELVENENAAAPVQERLDIEERLKSPNLTGSQRSILQDRLRQNTAGWGSVAAREDPYRAGSVARQRFSTLYRR